MSHYNPRHCPSHGDWLQDVDNPNDSRPDYPDQLSSAANFAQPTPRVHAVQLAFESVEVYRDNARRGGQNRPVENHLVVLANEVERLEKALAEAQS